MSNILKSTKLDIALVKPYFKTICFTLLLPIVFAAINRSLLTGVSFAMCFIAMTTGYTFSITEKNSMDRLFGILPVRKSELVIGRYVFVLAMGLLSLIISLIAQPLATMTDTIQEVIGPQIKPPKVTITSDGSYFKNRIIGILPTTMVA